jgi:Outer membrane efflux protein
LASRGHKKQWAAEVGPEGAAAQYRSTVIGAFRKVADALQAIKADARVMRAAKQCEAAAKKTVEVTRNQFRLGEASTLQLLTASRAICRPCSPKPGPIAMPTRWPCFKRSAVDGGTGRSRVRQESLVLQCSKRISARKETPRRSPICRQTQFWNYFRQRRFKISLYEQTFITI